MAFTMALTLMIILLGWFIWQLKNDLAERLAQKKFIQPTRYYAMPRQIRLGREKLLPSIKSILQAEQLRSRLPGQILLSNDYLELNSKSECDQTWGHEIAEDITSCILINLPANNKPNEITEVANWLLLFRNELLVRMIHRTQVPVNNEGDKAQNIENENIQGQETKELNFKESLIAQYIGEDPIMQIDHTIGEFPIHCLNAIMSIEDQKFLLHGGFSWSSFGRALIKNIRQGRAAQGGSTITQQLIKNYFLTSEKTVRRKFQELVMAVLLESQFSKDEILQTYLNIIYMGQNGSFKVHGYGAAAEYYFAKPISELNLPQCALLGAIVNSPGGYNPWKKQEAATKRRNLVLSKMHELSYIDSQELAEATNSNLMTSRTENLATETAPYFLHAVRRQMRDLQLPLEGAEIYTSLDMIQQQMAQESVQNHLSFLETNNKSIKSKKEKGKILEGLLLSADNTNGWIHVLVGGRNYRNTQFNRALESRRQVGSVMKPLVYLAALEKNSDLSPTSFLDDRKFSIQYEGQSWQPENYEKQYYGWVPMYFALTHSLNAATANLAWQIGLPEVIRVARALGAESELKPLPSISLGAFEMRPIEVLKIYSSLVRMGRQANLSLIRKVVNNQGKIQFEHTSTQIQDVDPVSAATVISMMKQNTISGTARGISRLNLPSQAAGKTGTTNDNKDSWFAGFTPSRTVITWVGYDDNTPSGLTGSSGALPAWMNFVKSTESEEIISDFTWPESTQLKKVSQENLQQYYENFLSKNNLNPDPKPFYLQEEDGVELLFKD